MEWMVVFNPRLQKVLEAFDEALVHREMRYRLNTLKRYGFDNDMEISMAIKRAMAICNGLGIDPKRHFGYFYKVDMFNKQAVREWKASKLGFYLVLCNGSPANPFTGALQFETLKGFLSKLE